ncbi:chemotaxis response regulator protein-glutamatemethylesterase 3 [Striga asiatica]|uniref:Chemotaxis response regulator protein-glutamatemethylesterase 3 n=1 Tax=Striga asiatica TaxID=4170 RepID=A0A5A7PSE3_STRAF|nr:chemotaxis response regulator protein-glutamatemethylesterase 3 [Striga asiatica]
MSTFGTRTPFLTPALDTMGRASPSLLSKGTQSQVMLSSTSLPTSFKAQCIALWKILVELSVDNRLKFSTKGTSWEGKHQEQEPSPKKATSKRDSWLCLTAISEASLGEYIWPGHHGWLLILPHTKSPTRKPGVVSIADSTTVSVSTTFLVKATPLAENLTPFSSTSRLAIFSTENKNES